MHFTTSCNTQASAPEDGRDHRTKHVELIGIINKPLVASSGCLYNLLRSFVERIFQECSELLILVLHYFMNHSALSYIAVTKHRPVLHVQL